MITLPSSIIPRNLYRLTSGIFMIDDCLKYRVVHFMPLTRMPDFVWFTSGPSSWHNLLNILTIITTSFPESATAARPPWKVKAQVFYLPHTIARRVDAGIYDSRQILDNRGRL